MDHRQSTLALSRRGVLTLAAGAAMTGWTRLYAVNSDFWNKKEPGDWTSEEIEKLTTKSPWTKEVTAQHSREEGERGGGMGGGRGSGGGMGGGRIGGLGIPGTGGGGMGYPGGMGGGGRGGGRGRGGGQPAQSFQGTVRWESARPILEALKTPLPDAFASHYVISVSGFPLNSRRRRGSQDDDDKKSDQDMADMLDGLKTLTFLEPKGLRGAQPGVVQQQVSTSGNVLFGFSTKFLNLKPEDKEVAFTTRLGGLVVKAKFNLKEMMYRGALAV